MTFLSPFPSPLWTRCGDQRAARRRRTAGPTTAEGLAVLRGTTFRVPAATELTPVDRVVSGPADEASVRIIRPDGPSTAWCSTCTAAVSCRRARRRRRGQRPAGPHGRRRRGVRPLPARAGAPVSGRPRRCLAAAVWLAGAVEEEFGIGRIVVSGNSAGDTWRCRRCWARDEYPSCSGGWGASLVFGVYDLARTPSSRSAAPDTPVLPPRWIDQFVGMAFPGLGRSSCATAVSPRCTPTCTGCRPRCSRSGTATRCWTIRCSWPRAGGPRGSERTGGVAGVAARLRRDDAADRAAGAAADQRVGEGPAGDPKLRPGRWAG